MAAGAVVGGGSVLRAGYLRCLVLKQGVAQPGLDHEAIFDAVNEANEEADEGKEAKKEQQVASPRSSDACPLQCNVDI